MILNILLKSTHSSQSSGRTLDPGSWEPAKYLYIFISFSLWKGFFRDKDCILSSPPLFDRCANILLSRHICTCDSKKINIVQQVLFIVTLIMIFIIGHHNPLLISAPERMDGFIPIFYPSESNCETACMAAKFILVAVKTRKGLTSPNIT